jgi:hypothetical protein
LRTLIDTNIFIGREANKPVSPELQELLKVLAKVRAEVLVHPKSIIEIENDSNKERRNISLSKINSYPALESPPDPTLDIFFLEKVGGSANSHDRIDNFMLYAVYMDAVNYLVTEDKDIHKKASRVSTRDRVFSCIEALDFFRNYLPREIIEHPPALHEEFVYNLKIEDPFFDSLRAEYREFDDWFKRIKRQGRKCFVYYKGNAISALLIYKDEDEAIPCIPPLLAHRRLKISTFKSDPSGNRLGELFIKMAVRYCVNNNIDEMYLTHFLKEEGDPLDKLLSDYGFAKKAKKSDGEDVYVKKLAPDLEGIAEITNFEIGRRYYPSFYYGKLVQKFIVPIRAEYHKRLFDDYLMYMGQSSLGRYVKNREEFIVEGNTISKAYLCHAHIKKIQVGDLLLFYRSWEKSRITAIGVVEKVSRFQEARKIAQIVGNRTVYSIPEIEDIAEKPTLVLLFRWHFYFPHPLTLNTLRRLRVLTNAPQSIITLTHENYLKIKKESRFNERYGRYTVN